MATIDGLRPQKRNANRHTPRGMSELERSIQQDGWIGAITVAADGETFDGSARIETAAATALDDAIIIESDGSRPVVVVRKDIPTADDARAVRLGLAANKIAADNLDWDPAVLAELAETMDLSGLFSDEELATALADAQQVEPGGGGDEFDPTPQEGPTRTQTGDLWQIGVHRLLVGDCTDVLLVDRLMDGAVADLSEIDPPYDMAPEQQAGVCAAAMGCIALWGIAFELVPVCQAWGRWPDLDLVWRFHFGRMYSKERPFCHHRAIWLFGFDYYNASWRNENGAPPSTFFEAAYVSQHHPHEKPLSFLAMLLEVYSPPRALVYVPFGGSGATLIAAHRTGRIARLMEIEPRYADVILRRAEAEGLTAARLEAGAL